MTMIYAIWQHVRSAETRLWAFPFAYICTLAITGALQFIRILYRNLVMGRSHVQLILQPHMGDVARITLSLPRPWVVRAGHRINLGIPYVGIFYLFQSHPFTISWWENDIEGRAISISIILRPRSGFTRRLLDRIEPNRQYRAWIDGPFGPSGVNGRLGGTIGDYGHIFLIATGIGIAAQLPYIKELLDGHEKAQVCTQRISLVWQLDMIGDWESARDLLQALVRQDNGYVSMSSSFV
jgi:predicted ferric reductase